MKVHYSADVVQNDAMETVSGTVDVVAKIGTVEEAASASSSHIILEVSRLNIAKAKETAVTLLHQPPPLINAGGMVQATSVAKLRGELPSRYSKLSLYSIL